jgi:hypothetical protein
MRGHRVTIASRAREAGLPYGLVNSRICRGWTAERALTTPDPDYTAVEKRNAAARARAIRAMAEREANASASAAQARAKRKATAAQASATQASATQAMAAREASLSLYSPRHVTTREPLAAPPPRHQAPIEATLDDDFIARHADALAIADAETYDAAFDPDFLFVPNPVREIWAELKRDRATS